MHFQKNNACCSIIDETKRIVCRANIRLQPPSTQIAPLRYKDHGCAISIKSHLNADYVACENCFILCHHVFHDGTILFATIV